MPVAPIKPHAAIGMRFHQAACVYPCEFNTSFIPQTTRATMGVGSATAGASVLPRIAHHQFVHAGVEQIVQPGDQVPSSKVTDKVPRKPAKN